jgi:hypothetical protein
MVKPVAWIITCLAAAVLLGLYLMHLWTPRPWSPPGAKPPPAISRQPRPRYAFLVNSGGRAIENEA